MNILSEEYKKIIKKGFQKRFSILVISGLSLCFLFAIFSLIPTYLLIREHISILDKDNNSLDKKMIDMIEIPKKIEKQTKDFQLNINEIKITDLNYFILEKAKNLAFIESINFDRTAVYKEQEGMNLFIKGLSSNRENLVKFVDLLKTNDLFTNVDLPFSSFKKDKDIPFSINIFILK